MHGSGAGHRCGRRSSARITAFDLGVPQPWGIPGRPRIERSGAGAGTRRARVVLPSADGRYGWRVCLPEVRVGSTPWGGLVPEERIPMFAARAADVADPDAVRSPGIWSSMRIPRTTSVVAAYGGWMSDDALARLLIVPEDLTRPGRRFIVGSVRGHPIGCAFVWWAAGPATSPGSACCPTSADRATAAR